MRFLGVETRLSYFVECYESSSHHVEVSQCAAKNEIARKADARQNDPRYYCTSIIIILVDFFIVSVVFNDFEYVYDGVAKYEYEFYG